MPIPSRKLLFGTAMVALLCTAAGPMPTLVPWAAMAVVALVLAALGDFVWSREALDRVSIEIPGTQRFSKDRESELLLRFANSSGKAIRLRVAVGLPPSFTFAHPEWEVTLPAEEKSAQVILGCTGHARGKVTEAGIGLETLSKGRLWHIRRRERLTVDVRVYPNLFTERKHVAVLFLARNRLGTRIQRTVGRGREFEKLREYLPGDGMDEIHWKASAKRRRPITKVYQAEQTQEIYVLVDASRLSGRKVVNEGVEQTLLERYLTAALVLLLAAEQQGDRFGLGVFDSRLHTFVRAGHGESHRTACREALCQVQPTEQVTDVAEIVRSLRVRLHRRSLLFILTDLTDPVLAESYTQLIPLIARQHIVFINQIPAEGIAPLFSAPLQGSDESELIDAFAGHIRWEELRATQRRLKAQGATATLLTHESLAAELVTQYLDVKRRQVL